MACTKNVMNSIKLFFILMILISFAADFAYSQNDWSSEPQTTKTIIFKDSLVLEKKINLEEREIFTLRLIDIDTKGNIVGFGFSHYNIFYFNIANNYEQITIGDGRGGGPKEFRGVFDLKFSKSGDIWVSDKDQYRLSRWSSSGKLIKNIVLSKNIQPTRIAVCPNSSIYILSRSYNKNGILHRVTDEGKLILTFQQLDTELARSPFYFDGQMACYNENLFFAGQYNEFFRKYDKNGTLEFSKSIVGFEPNNKIIEESKNGKVLRRTLSDEAKQASGDIYYNNGKVWIGYSGKKDGWLYRIDVYDPENGSYIYSYPLKIPAKEFAINGNKVAVLEYAGKPGTVNLAIYTLPFNK